MTYPPGFPDDLKSVYDLALIRAEVSVSAQMSSSPAPREEDLCVRFVESAISRISTEQSFAGLHGESTASVVRALNDGMLDDLVWHGYRIVHGDHDGVLGDGGSACRATVKGRVRSGQSWRDHLNRVAELRIRGTGSNQPPSRHAGPKLDRWSDLALVLTSDFQLQVFVRDEALATCTYADLGFSDGRNEKPVNAWEYLKAFTVDGRLPARVPKRTQLEKQMQTIRKKLRDYFGHADGDPIPMNNGFYEPAFRIRKHASVDA